MIENRAGSNAVSRRGFMQRAACAAAGSTLAGLSNAVASGQDRRDSGEVMREFPYGATGKVAPGLLATVTNRWKAGDTVDLVVPQPLRTLSIDAENTKLAALMRGAVMYVGLNPWDGIGEQSIELPGSLSPLSASGQAYRTVIGGRDLVFVPYFTVDTERYNTYFRIA